jgi:hypothetical protein
MDKAKEYVKIWKDKLKETGALSIETEIELAFATGYRQGNVDAHRKESVSEVQENFARELR